MTFIEAMKLVRIPSSVPRGEVRMRIACLLPSTSRELIAAYHALWCKIPDQEVELWYYHHTRYRENLKWYHFFKLHNSDALRTVPCAMPERKMPTIHIAVAYPVGKAVHAYVGKFKPRLGRLCLTRHTKVDKNVEKHFKVFDVRMPTALPLD